MRQVDEDIDALEQLEFVPMLKESLKSWREGILVLLVVVLSAAVAVLMFAVRPADVLNEVQQLKTEVIELRVEVSQIKKQVENRDK